MRLSSLRDQGCEDNICKLVDIVVLEHFCMSWRLSAFPRQVVCPRAHLGHDAMSRPNEKDHSPFFREKKKAS